MVSQGQTGISALLLLEVHRVPRAPTTSLATCQVPTTLLPWIPETRQPLLSPEGSRACHTPGAPPPTLPSALMAVLPCFNVVCIFSEDSWPHRRMGPCPPCPGDMRPGKAAGRASDQPLSKRFAPHGATPVFRTGRHQSLTCAGAVSRAAKTASSSPLNGTEVGATPTTPTMLTGKQARKSQSQEEAEQGLDVLSLKGSFESPCPPPTSSPHPPHGRASTRWGQTLLDGPRAGSAWRTMGPPRADM